LDLSFYFLIHGEPYVKEKIRLITRAIARRMEEEDEVQKTLLLWRVKY